MRQLGGAFLAFTLLLTSIPHTFCLCGCSWLLRSDRGRLDQAATACPHCRHSSREANRGEADPQQPSSCECVQCSVKYVAPSTLASPDTTLLTWSFPFASAALPAGMLDSVNRLEQPAAERVASSLALPVRALPVWLERLLL